MTTRNRVTRRRLLKDTGLGLLAAGSAPVLSTPFISRAMADTKTLSIVQWSHFVPGSTISPGIGEPRTTSRLASTIFLSQTLPPALPPRHRLDPATICLGGMEPAARTSTASSSSM
ncbi:twin-arginine translocation signal domain-containing protein [Bradyrhizobium centrolobii]|uniref:twin-arginine translocation signal domain-containing protein n=1 Tax=Bradyrhizobium centrolobii TaxID=1505087 RepID=UPI000A55DCF7